jgi:glycosyltransferase involved in cell wall biosynthesis
MASVVEPIAPVAAPTRSPWIDGAPRGTVHVAQVVTRFIAGAGGVALRGALALDRDRYRTTVFAADGGQLLDEAEAHGLEVIRLRHMRPDINLIEDRRGRDELLRHFTDRRFDIVHTHSAKAGALGRIAARRAGVGGIVHTFHGFPFHEFQSTIRRAAYLRAERRLARDTDMCFAVGSATAADVVRLGIAPPDRVRAIVAPVTSAITELSRVSRAHARRLLRVPPGYRVIGTVGRLDHQKAPEDLVRAVAMLRDLPVYAIWIGDGPLRRRVERLIERLGLEDRFALVGERDDVGALLPAFDVFALASLYEGLPCAVVEAMRCGVPVVATAVNAVPDVVIAGRTGLLARPRDPASVADAIAYMLAAPAHAAAMAHAAKERVGEPFDSAALGVQLDDVYAALVQSPTRERRAIGEGSWG